MLCCREEFVDLEAEFQPSLINTTIYIISMAMQITTFAVNYKVLQNTSLLAALLIFINTFLPII